MTLRGKPTATLTDLARSHCYDAGALSRLVDDLVRRSFIARERSGIDRRVILLNLTHQGDQLLQKMLPQVVVAWNALLEGFGAGEIRSLADSLRRLRESCR